jgi:hypothetical protein
MDAKNTCNSLRVNRSYLDSKRANELQGASSIRHVHDRKSDHDDSW